MSLFEVMPDVFRRALLDAVHRGKTNASLSSAVMFEYIAFQMYQLAPLEFEEFLKMIPEQCRTPHTPHPGLTQAREDLVLTMEMVIAQYRND